ncbi:MAG: aldehyde dehydrogenase family protein, partial [Acidimicrobiales bacterium]
VKRSFRNAGQLCNSVNRIFVVRSVADEFLERFASRASKLVVGPGLDQPEADVGPLTNAETRDNMEDHVAGARKLEPCGQTSTSSCLSRGLHS